MTRKKQSILWNHIDEVIELYKNGKSIDFLGDKFNLTKRSISLFLKKNNIALRGSFKKLNNSLKNEIIEQYQKGINTDVLAKKYGVHQSTICRFLKKNGIKMRISIPPSFFGKKHSNKTKIKMSDSQKGKNLGKSYEEIYGVKKAKIIKIKLSNSFSGKNNPMFGKFGENHPAFGRKANEDEKIKKSEALRGEKCYNWKGGKKIIHDIIRDSSKYKEWRLKFFSRDNFICMNCGTKIGPFNVHHCKKQLSEIIDEYNIKSFNDALKCEELWSENNGITLCKNCHKMIKHRGSGPKVIKMFKNT